MFSRVLFVGPSSLGRASFSHRLQETLRELGHAVQVCPDPGEESAGKVAYDAMLAAFAPTLILWDAGTVDPAPFAEAIADASCCVAAIRGRFLPEGAERAVERAFDTVISVNLTRRDDSSDLYLPACVDARYLRLGLSDETERRFGVLLCGSSDEGRLDALRECLPDEAQGRVESLVDLEARLGVNVAYALRTFEYAYVPFDPAGVCDADSAMRLGEGQTVVIERKEGFEIICASENFRILNRVHVDGGDASTALAAAVALRAGGPAGDHEPLTTLDDYLPLLLDEMNALARRRGKSPVLACSERARLVLAYGWFGAHNYGDDLLLRLVADRCGERYGNFQMAALGADARVLRCEFGLEAVTPDEKEAIGRLLTWSSALVYCGGLIFDQPMARTAGELEFMYDPWHEPSCQADIALAAAASGAAPVMLGIGGGPIAKSGTRFEVKLMGLAGTLFLTRDRNTADLLVDAGAPASNVEVMADLVLGGRSYVERHASTSSVACAGTADGYFIVSLRRWPGLPDDFETKVAWVIDRVIEKTGLRAAFLPFDVDDIEIHRTVAAKMARADRAFVFDERPDEPELLGCVEGSRFAIAMRLHCSVLHHVLGKPAFGLSYNDKIEAYYDASGQSDVLFPLEFDGEALVRAVEETHCDPLARVAAITAAVTKEAAVVDVEFDRLFSIIDKAGDRRASQVETLYPRTIDVHEVRAWELEQRCSELEVRVRDLGGEVETTQHEIAEVRASKSYRIGNALMKPLAALRRLLQGRR